MRTSLLDSPPHGRRATWTTHQGQRSKAPPEVQNQPSTAEGEPFLKPPSFCDRPKKRSTQQKPGRRLRQTAQHPKGAGKPKPHAETAERPHKMSGSPKTSPRPSPPGLGTAVSPVNVLLRTQPRGLSFTGDVNERTGSEVKKKTHTARQTNYGPDENRYIAPSHVS